MCGNGAFVVGLTAFAEVPPAYPEDIPEFRVIINRDRPELVDKELKLVYEYLKIDNKEKDNINISDFYIHTARNIEIAVNTEFDYITESNRMYLFSLMVYKLQLCFDLYCDAIQENNYNNGALKLNQVIIFLFVFLCINNVIRAYLCSVGGCAFEKLSWTRQKAGICCTLSVNFI
ncbi:hypothetical protein RFI_04262 [Reticulomyxa filosa]|uniref:Uncharacterized protein n=1 Tax=Reticulomyxa filosa TaxID=46433 RepID=X6P2R7_RETFI|nr:hypothetical protein RFI_04262 [Reticulomyxa filosa]|eukprot:ETO32855.1 hypothetical protein RFI_04262 [Reticulomyxa filosa]